MISLLFTDKHVKKQSREAAQRCSIKKVFLKISKLTGNALCHSLFFNKVAGLKLLTPATLVKKRLWHRRFPVNFAKILRTPFLLNTSGGCYHNSHHHHHQLFIVHCLKSVQIRSFFLVHIFLYLH